jgi:hypothetical protein
VRLSSNKDATGLALIGIEATRVPNVLKVEGLRKGIVQRRSSNSTLNIRVDYQDRNGEYVHSVLYHEGVYTTGRTFQLPWGTKRTPDEIVEVESLNDCSIDVAAHKPDSFNGRVTISFELQNVGMGVKQNFQLSRGSSSGVEGFLEDSDGMGRGNDGRPQEVYNPCGQRQPQLVKGINIVHSPDGSTQKVYVK